MITLKVLFWLVLIACVLVFLFIITRPQEQTMNDYGGGYTLEDIEEWRAENRKCKICGKTGFEWVETESGWRLEKDGEIHECWKEDK